MVVGNYELGALSTSRTFSVNIPKYVYLFILKYCSTMRLKQFKKITKLIEMYTIVP